MQQVSEITLITAQASNGSGAPIWLGHDEDTFVLHPVTSGGSAAMTVNIEMVAPDGVSWNLVATRNLSTVGPQQVIQLYGFPGRAIRASVTGLSAGTVTIQGYMARQ